MTQTYVAPYVGAQHHVQVPGHHSRAILKITHSELRAGKRKSWREQPRLRQTESASSSMADTKQVVVTLKLSLQHRSDDPDGVRRLRQMLKTMLRSFGVRCVEIKPVTKAST